MEFAIRHDKKKIIMAILQKRSSIHAQVIGPVLISDSCTTSQPVLTVPEILMYSYIAPIIYPPELRLHDRNKIRWPVRTIGEE